jgi:hypothetical protein
MPFFIAPRKPTFRSRILDLRQIQLLSADQVRVPQRYNHTCETQ